MKLVLVGNKWFLFFCILCTGINSLNASNCASPIRRTLLIAADNAKLQTEINLLSTFLANNTSQLSEGISVGLDFSISSDSYLNQLESNNKSLMNLIGSLIAGNQNQSVVYGFQQSINTFFDSLTSYTNSPSELNQKNLYAAIPILSKGLIELMDPSEIHGFTNREINTYNAAITGFLTTIVNDYIVYNNIWLAIKTGSTPELQTQQLGAYSSELILYSQKLVNDWNSLGEYLGQIKISTGS